MKITNEMVAAACQQMWQEYGYGDGDWHAMYLALRAALAEVPQTEQLPVAWRTFDGEGGWDFCDYENNETYRDDYIKRNGEWYASWVEPLYTNSQPEPVKNTETFVKALSHAINRHSKENGSNTPDWILGELLEQVLYAFDTAVRARETFVRNQ